MTTIFIVVHIGTHSSRIPQILTSAGHIPAIHPTHGQTIQTGMIYIAPPDHHLLIGDGVIELSHGPKENNTRPSINPLFRSAVIQYGSRVTGILMTGMQDDGVAGLAEIKRKGGVVIVQDPKTALYPSMPRKAIEEVSVDYILPVEDMPELLNKICNRDIPEQEKEAIMEERKIELTCPECRGPLSERITDSIHEFHCRVGHAYSLSNLSESHKDTLERKLWEAVLALEEAADIEERMTNSKDRYGPQVQRRRAQAALVRDILLNENPPRQIHTSRQK